ncbi:MAG: sulfatase [bacterium]|nr:sulfatase [bacterium]
MSRLSFAALLLTLLAALTACQSAGSTAQGATARPPNVVLIISDDQAWGDFGFMGHPEIRTPHIDRLAARSVVFERGYVPSSLCRPSLATMITGLYPHQHLITGNDPPKGIERDRMLAHIAAVDTLPKMLAPLGYRSLQTGKWWEGNCQCGGFTEGMTHGDPARGGRHGDVGLRIGRKTMRPIQDFLDDCGESPFFLWYAPFLPHTPHNPPQRLLKKYQREGRTVHIARYLAMCEWFDETCGQLLADLDERGLTDNTMVVFAVDNGWIQRPNRRGYAQRSKRTPYEGGVRTPIMVAWPGHMQAARSTALASTVDLAPTILAACGAPVPANLPGHDLLAVAAGTTAPRTQVYGEIFTHDVVEVGKPTRSLLHRWIVRDRWKLIVPQATGAAAELYDVVADPSERRDLAAVEPSRVANLKAALDAWWPVTR